MRIAMRLDFDRRQFLLGSAAATGALALSGCAGMVPRSETAAARALYDSIFEGMLRASPEMATGLGLDTGERAYLQEPARRFLAGRQDGRLPAAARPSARSCAGSTAPRSPAASGPGSTPCSGSASGSSDGADHPLWRHRRLRLSGPLCPLAADRLLSGASPISSTASTRSRPARTPRPMSPGSRRSRANIDLEVDQARADAGRGVVPPAFILDKALDPDPHAARRARRAKRAWSSRWSAARARRRSPATGERRPRRSSTAASPPRSTARSPC